MSLRLVSVILCEGLSSQHLKSVSSVVAGDLASLVTACLRHGNVSVIL